MLFYFLRPTAYDKRFGVKKVLVCCVIFKCRHGVSGVGVFLRMHVDQRLFAFVLINW